jgi:hypothetical protein
MLVSVDLLRMLSCSALSFAGACALANDEAGPAAPPPPRALITVIALPSPAGTLPEASRQRTHHALSFATDAPKPLLRSLGLDASECALRLRLPTRLTPSRTNSTGVRVDVEAQAGLGCRF